MVTMLVLFDMWVAFLVEVHLKYSIANSFNCVLVCTGTYIGVEWDSKEGKNSGEVDGQQLFECQGIH